MVYAREFDGQAHEFGVIGVDEGTLIMYDAQTRSRWSQLFGTAVEGPMSGRTLEKLPSVMTTWRKWRELHPDTTVYVKRSIPYRARFTEETFAATAIAPGDGPLQAEDWIVGVEGHVDARAYPARVLVSERVINDTLEGAGIVVFLSQDSATARVFRSAVGEESLTFTVADGDRMRDTDTGSLWDPLSGEAIEGPLRGETLQPLISTYSLWFAWEKYRPDTVVYGLD